MWEFITGLGDKVFSEAGILALIEFWLCVYFIWDNRGLRKELKIQNEKLYDLGVQSVASSVETNNVLDKIGETLSVLSKSNEGKKP
jgi:hypothetical protein